MNPYPTIIDCDPGADDVAALILARALDASGELNVRGVTVVAGNVPLEKAARNALNVCGFLDWDVPVAAGAAKPLACDLLTAEEIHGADGMAGISLPRSIRRLARRPAWKLIRDVAFASDVPIDIIATGPLTNVAIALATYPGLAPRIRRIVSMGGGVLAGNTTPAAEFNILVDPEAAQRVVTSGIDVYLCPLDVTHEAYITRTELAAVRKFDSPEARLFADVLGAYIDVVERYSGGRGAALHDPTAVLYAVAPTLFREQRCWVGVETQGRVTRGQTVTDLNSDKKLTPNATVVTHVGRGAFISRIMALLATY